MDRIDTASADVPARLRPVTPMAILAEELAALEADAGTMDGADAAFVTRLQRARQRAAALEGYLESMTTPASTALEALATATRTAAWSDDGSGLEAEMLSGHVEGQFLRWLVAASGARRLLEIGLFTGYSALAMAEALPADGQLLACEVDARAAGFARAAFAEAGLAERLTIELAPAADTLARLAAAGERFDFVFIDADKSGYGAYLDALLDDGLLAPGGLIVVDNTLLQGEPYLDAPRSPNGEAIAAFNARVAADARLEQVLLPLRDGVTLIRRIDV